METFKQRAEDYISKCFPMADERNRTEIRRIFYAGALELLVLFNTTSDDEDQEEKEVLAIDEEIRTWSLNEARVMIKEAEERNSGRRTN